MLRVYACRSMSVGLCLWVYGLGPCAPACHLGQTASGLSFGIWGQHFVYHTTAADDFIRVDAAIGAVGAVGRVRTFLPALQCNPCQRSPS